MTNTCGENYQNASPWSHNLNCLLSFFFLVYFIKIFFVLMFVFERERASEQRRGRGRGRHRIWSRLQGLSCQHRAWHGTQTHDPWDHDLSQSRTLNRLSHPGAPIYSIFQREDRVHAQVGYEQSERQRQRILSRLRTARAEPIEDEGLEPKNHEIMTRAEIKSLMLNPLSHPGAPTASIL